MARREVERQLRLFGVGDLGPPEDRVFRHLGRLLREEGFEDYLTHRQPGREHSDG